MSQIWKEIENLLDTAEKEFPNVKRDTTEWLEIAKKIEKRDIKKGEIVGTNILCGTGKVEQVDYILPILPTNENLVKIASILEGEHQVVKYEAFNGELVTLHLYKNIEEMPLLYVTREVSSPDRYTIGYYEPLYYQIEPKERERFVPTYFITIRCFSEEGAKIVDKVASRFGIKA
jgi:hypothetical protein